MSQADPKAASDSDWNDGDQDPLNAFLAATPAQCLAWLEGVLRIAYASGALKPRLPRQE